MCLNYEVAYKTLAYKKKKSVRDINLVKASNSLWKTSERDHRAGPQGGRNEDKKEREE